MCRPIVVDVTAHYAYIPTNWVLQKPTATKGAAALTKPAAVVQPTRFISWASTSRPAWKTTTPRVTTTSSHTTILPRRWWAIVTPNAAGWFWGGPQVIRLKACITSTPMELCLPYPTMHTAEWRGKAHRQSNTLCHCKVQLKKQCFTNMANAERCLSISLIYQADKIVTRTPPRPPKSVEKRRAEAVAGGRCGGRRWQGGQQQQQQWRQQQRREARILLAGVIFITFITHSSVIYST